jgi:protoporphyrinogen oxidase
MERTSTTGHVVLIGAGPAGLAVAAELAKAGHQVIILEKDSSCVEGIARTVHYRDYRFDIDGHRFLSKSSEVTEWWHKRLSDDFISVNRLSRIYCRGKFFNYPLKASNALFGFGVFTKRRLCPQLCRSPADSYQTRCRS